MAKYTPDENFLMILDADIVLADPDGSNVPVTEAEWQATGVDYSDGDQVRVGTDLYESTYGDSGGGYNTTDPVTEAAKTDKEAETSPRGWVLLGKINRWEMFSDTVNRQTIKASPIEVLLEVPETTNVISLFNVSGAKTATITTYDAAGNVTGTFVENFVSTGQVTGWWSYFHRRRTTRSEMSNLDIPGYGTHKIRVVLENDDGGDIGVGKMVVGQQSPLGIALLPFESGIYSASTVEQDDFGTLKIFERPSAKYGVYSVLVPRSRIDSVQRELAATLNKPTVFMADPESPEAILIGITKEIRIIREEGAPDWGKFQLETIPLI